MRKLRSILKVALWTIGGVVGVTVLAGAALALRLVSGPINTSVPQALLDRVVAEAAPGWHVEAGGAQLDFSSDDGLNGLKLHDVVLWDKSGHQVVSAPVLGLRFALAASLNPADALTVREVALTGASVDVIRATDGTFQLAFSDMASAGGTGDGDGGDDPLASLSDLGDLGSLPQLRIEDAQVRYTDLARGTSWQTEKARLTLSPGEEGLSGSLAMVINGGIGGAQLDAFHRSEDGQVTARLTLDGVRPSRVAELDPLLAALARIDAPLSGTVDVVGDDGGSFRSIEAQVSASHGSVRLTETSTLLDSFSASLSCEVEAKSCDISDLSISTPDFTGAAKGTLHQNAPDMVAATLHFGTLTGRDGPVSASVGKASVAANVHTGTGQVTVERAFAEELALTGLPEGMSATISKVGATGAFDPESDLVSLQSFVAQEIALVDPNGTNQTVAGVKGTLTYEPGADRLSISRIEADGIAVATPDAALVASKIAGGAVVDLQAQRIVLSPTVLSDARLRQAGTVSTRIANVTVEGTVDVAAQSFTDGVVRVQGAALAVPDLYRDPLSISDATLKLAAAFEDGAARLTLKSAVAEVDGLPAKAKGNIALRANGTALGRLEASLGPVSVDRVAKHWPLPVAPGGFQWVSSNVSDGIVDKVTLSAQFDEARPDQDALDLHFGFRGASVSFVPGMPPIKGASGTGHVTLDRLILALTDGKVDAPGAGPLTLEGSSFEIPDFAPAVPLGKVKLRASGDVRSVLRLLDTEPLGVISPTGFDIATAKGRANVRVLLDLPLSDDLSVDDVQFDARAKIHKYSLNEPQTDLPVSGDLLLVKATGDGLTVQSDARIAGLAARLGYSQGFAEPNPGEPDSILTLESFLSLGDFARHGLILDDHVEGLTAMKARIEMFEGGAARINADADLTNLRLKADRVGWSKAAGIPATVRLSGFRNPDGAGRIEALALRGQGLSADGSIGFSADGQITRANFSQIVLGSAVDIGLIYGLKTNGDVGILVKGAQLDLRPAFAAALEGEQAPSKQTTPGNTSTDVSVQVGRVFLRDDLGVFDLKGGLRLKGGALHAANVAGKLNGSAPAKLLAERRRDGTAIRLTSPDAGAFIRATDVFAGAYDGALTLDAFTQEGAVPSRISGKILVSDMVVHDAPTLGKILSGGAVGTLLGDLANGGIKFTKIELPFNGVGSKWLIADGVAFGPQIGLTLEGGYDVAHGGLSLNGSVSPAYAINGALGNVPLLGNLLTGGEGEGVFGVTFSVNGDTNQPEVSVNPLSALAPGFLRKLVTEVGKGGTGEPAPPAQDR